MEDFVLNHNNIQLNLKNMLHPEERQYLKDLSYIEAERDFLYWQDWNEEMESLKHQKAAKITITDEDKLLEDDRIEIDTCSF